MYCKTYTPEQLNTKFPNGFTLAYYVTEVEAYVLRASIPFERLNGLPSCPFAGIEMKKDRIAYDFINVKNPNFNPNQRIGKKNPKYIVPDEALEKIQAFKDGEKKTLFLICLDIDEQGISLEAGMKLAGDCTIKYLDKYPAKEDLSDEIIGLFNNYKVEHDFFYCIPPQFYFILCQYNADLDKGIEILEKNHYYDNLDFESFVGDSTEMHPVLKKRGLDKCPYSGKTRTQEEVEIDFEQEKLKH